MTLPLLCWDRVVWQLIKLAKVWEDVVAEEEQAVGKTPESDRLGTKPDPWPPKICPALARKIPVGQWRGKWFKPISRFSWSMTTNGFYAPPTHSR